MREYQGSTEGLLLLVVESRLRRLERILFVNRGSKGTGRRLGR